MRHVIDSKTRCRSLVAEPEQSAKSEFLVVTRTRAARCHFRHTRGALKMSIWSKKEKVCGSESLVATQNGPRSSVSTNLDSRGRLVSMPLDSELLRDNRVEGYQRYD